MMTIYRPLLLDVVELEKENDILRTELAEVKEQLKSAVAITEYSLTETKSKLSQERARKEYLLENDNPAWDDKGWYIPHYYDETNCPIKAKNTMYYKTEDIAIDAAIESSK